MNTEETIQDYLIKLPNDVIDFIVCNANLDEDGNFTLPQIFRLTDKPGVMQIIFPTQTQQSFEP